MNIILNRFINVDIIVTEKAWISTLVVHKKKRNIENKLDFKCINIYQMKFIRLHLFGLIIDATFMHIVCL